jgi:uncharacterized alpha-E superfamily protein
MLLSRVADGLYWISRYLERAEHTSRLISVRLDLGLDRRLESDGWDFARLYAGLRLQAPEAPPLRPAELVDAFVFDQTNGHSVAACVTAARENARQVREQISSEMWEQVNALFLNLKQLRAENTWSGRPHYLLGLVIEGVHLFQGITDATMGHGEGWQYLQVGRFLERAGSTSALLDLYYPHPANRRDARPSSSEDAEWVGLLRSCSALESYCRRYTADLRPERIAEFLLLNPEFPRSVRFAASRVESALRAIGQLTSRGAGGRGERLAGRLHASLDYGQVDEILSEDPHAYLESIGRYCAQIHAAVYEHYITYSAESAVPA